jgi:hypothetical protein
MAEINLNDDDFNFSSIDWEDLVLKPVSAVVEKPKNKLQPEEAETL